MGTEIDILVIGNFFIRKEKKRKENKNKLLKKTTKINMNLIQKT